MHVKHVYILRYILICTRACVGLAGPGVYGAGHVSRIIHALYMVLVTVVLLSLLISIINDSYARIRKNAQWESLR